MGRSLLMVRIQLRSQNPHFGAGELGVLKIPTLGGAGGWGWGWGLVIGDGSVSFTAPFGWALVPGPGPGPGLGGRSQLLYFILKLI